MIASLSAATRSFTFNGGDETISLVDAAGAAMTIDSTLGESVTFLNPADSLTINTGSGEDTLLISSVDAAYRAALSINGNDGTDAITLGASLTLGSGTIVGNLTVTGETINLNASVDTTNAASNVTTAGSINLQGNVVLGANVSLTTDDGTGVDGNVSISGTVNADAAASDRTLSDRPAGVASRTCQRSLSKASTQTCACRPCTT